MSPKTCPRHILWGNDYMGATLLKKSFQGKLKEDQQVISQEENIFFDGKDK